MGSFTIWLKYQFISHFDVEPMKMCKYWWKCHVDWNLIPWSLLTSSWNSYRCSTIGAIVMTPLLTKLLAGQLVPVDAAVSPDGLTFPNIHLLRCCIWFNWWSLGLFLVVVAFKGCLNKWSNVTFIRKCNLWVIVPQFSLTSMIAFYVSEIKGMSCMLDFSHLSLKKEAEKSNKYLFINVFDRKTY